MIHRNLDEDRAGWRSASDAAGSTNRDVEVRSVFRLQLGLGHVTGHPGLIDIVELESLVAIGPDTAGQHQHRYPIEEGFGDPRQGMGEPGAGHEIDAAQGAGRPGDPVGHEGSALLVGHQDGANELRAGERIVELDIMSARYPKRERNALVLEGADDDVAACHLRSTHQLRSSRDC